jgi:hypothetical protein
MDATQEFLRQKEIQVPEKFVVAGFSKVNLPYNLLEIYSFNFY